MPCLCLYLLLVSLHQEWLKNGFLFLIMSKNSTVFCVFVDNFVPVFEGNSFPFRFADCFFFFFQVQENIFYISLNALPFFSEGVLCMDNCGLVLDGSALHLVISPSTAFICLPFPFCTHREGLRC